MMVEVWLVRQCILVQNVGWPIIIEMRVLRTPHLPSSLYTWSRGKCFPCCVYNNDEFHELLETVVHLRTPCPFKDCYQ